MGVFHSNKSQSTNTGLQPDLITLKAEEIIVNVGIITSEFFFIFKDFNAISRAEVPLETATPYFLLLNLAKSF